MATKSQAGSTSTNTLGGDCVDKAGQGTSTRVGDASAKQSSSQTLKRTKSKLGMELEFSAASNISVTSSSSKCVDKKKKKRKCKEPTANQLKLRAVADAGNKWELDLQNVHGLTNERAMCVMFLMDAYLNNDTFPPTNGNYLMEHAEEGWKIIKESNRIMKLYPDSLNQEKINGEWKLL